MILTTLMAGLLGSGLAVHPAPLSPSGDLVAVRVGSAHTVSHGTLNNAVILVEGGKIVAVGEDLPIERGIPVVDRPGWVVTPGLVNCYSRLGLDSAAGRDFAPQVHASAELYPGQEIYGEVLEAGVTTLGLYPAGTGVPGQAVAVRPRGETAADMIIEDELYLKVLVGADANAKKMLRDAFGKADDYLAKVEKAREKWEKDQEKKKKKSKSKKDEDKEKAESKSASKSSDEFTPPQADPKVAATLELRSGDLPALMRIQKAADFLHMMDVIKDEGEVRWMLRCPLRNDIDLFKVADRVGEHSPLIVLDPMITLQANTRRERNIPAEFAAAGAHLALVPPRDNLKGHEDWPNAVAQLVRAGLDADTALAAMTLVPAEVLGLEDRLGSLDEGKDANLVFWNGNPFEVGSEIKAVMLEGTTVFGELD